ncbi:MAG: PAS domain S-box protein [Deltaproteobacteria bacterium]|nr:PAS domain S-box protein [Deltaproteobacteria bacterium]
MIEKSNRQYVEEIKSLRRQMAYSEQLKIQYQETIEKLSENEKLYRDLADNDPDWTFWLNADDRLIYISPSSRRLTGYEPEDFKKDAKLLFKIIHPDDRTAFDDHVRFMHKAKSHVEEEFRIVRKDRKTRWISHSCQPVYDADGQYAGILCSNRDITESKDTGNVSQEGEKLYRLVAENMSDVIWMMDVSLQPTYISPSIERLRGFTPQEAMEQNLREALTPASLQHFNEIWIAEIAQERSGKALRNRPLTVQLEFKCKDGSTVWTETEITPLRNEEKKMVEILGVSRNITATKQTLANLSACEEKLQKGENQLQAVLNAATESTFVIDIDGHIELANEVTASRLGTDLETLLKKGNINDFIPPDVGVKRRLLFLQAQKTGKPVHFQDELNDRVMFNSVYPILEEEGKVNQLAVFSTDITDRKAAESADQTSRLRQAETERLLQLIINALPVRIYWKDKQSSYVGANRSFAKDAGCEKPEDLIGGGDQNMTWSGRADVIREEDLSVMSGRAKINCEESQIMPDGRERWLNTTKVPLTDTDGRAIGVLGFYEDISEQKRVEAELAERTNRILQLENQIHHLKRQIQQSESQMRQNENQMQALLDATTESIFLTDAEGRILYANETAARRLNTDLTTLLSGRTMYDFVSPATGEKRRKLVAESLRTGQPVRFEEKRTDETILNSLYPIKREGGNVTQMAFFGIDITEQRTAMEALEENVKLYRSLFENNRMAMLLIDPESGAIRDANPAACAFYGWNREELTQKKISTLDTLPAKEISKKMKLAGARESSPVLFKHKRADGSVRDVEVTSSVVQVSGKPVICAMIYDVTDRIQLKEPLKQPEKLDSLSILAGGIAHDFNNLMTIVQGNIDVALFSLPEEETARQSLQMAQEAVEKTRDITNRLITFSRGGTPVFKICRIENLLRESANTSLQSSQVRLVMDIPAELWPAEVDPLQIRQCFSHLADNAREAMPDGGTLTIHAENADITDADTLPLAEGPYLKITFEDNGSGIPAEHIARIFDPYYSTKPMSKDKGTGLGLGLAVCHSVLKKHGGYITVNSTEGCGAIFSLYLPAQPGSVVDEVPPVVEQAPAPKRILIMDDNEDIRKILQIYMEKLGFAVTGVSSGQEVIRIYQEARAADEAFSAVFMEISVKQGLGGDAALAKLKNIDPDVKAVAILSEFGDSQIQDFLDRGFRDVLGKPFRLENMKKILKNLSES